MGNKVPDALVCLVSSEVMLIGYNREKNNIT